MDNITCWLVGNAVFNGLPQTFRAQGIEAEREERRDGEHDGEKQRENENWEEEIQTSSQIRMFGCYCFPCLTSWDMARGVEKI